MLDRALHSHLDSMEEIERAIVVDIDNIMKSIDIDAVMENPRQAMDDAVELVKAVMIDKYAPMATREGFDLAKLLKKFIAKDKDIIIDQSKDPNKNEDALDGRNN